MAQALAQNREAILKAWLARTLETYPVLTSRFLLEEKDRFRNPVGHALREGLPILLDGLLGGMDGQRITPVLEEIVRMRAVQDFTPSQAISFIFLLRPILRQARSEGDVALFEDRVDQLALLAFDLFVKYREKIYEVKANEARRGRYVQDRLSSPAAADSENHS